MSTNVKELRNVDWQLTYRPRTMPWSNPDATALVEGAFGDAFYRLSWQLNPDNDAIGVEWESRDERGVGLGGSGIGRSTTEDITYLDPSGASVAGRGFVYVPTPLSIDRVAWTGPNGQVDRASPRRTGPLPWPRRSRRDVRRPRRTLDVVVALAPAPRRCRSSL